MKLAKASEIRRTLARAKDVAEVNELGKKASALAEYERLHGAWMAALEYEAVALDAHLESGRRLIEMAKSGQRRGRGRVKPSAEEGLILRDIFRLEEEAAQLIAHRQRKAYRIDQKDPARTVAYRKEQEAARANGCITLRGFLGERAHVSQNTGQPEWYTPAEYIEAARRVLGGIDLDPASSDLAQKTVKASVYYTAKEDGLAQVWKGRVWMNPPYTAGLVEKFIEKLCGHVTDGSVPAAVVLVNNATDTGWFQLAAKLAAALCFPSGRIRFIDEDGNPSGAPLQGQALLYFGEDREGFWRVFRILGFCSAPWPE